jgi:CDP-diacylglycerol--glycerol-3-phosphate 3-phosphatidyltransferase
VNVAWKSRGRSWFRPAAQWLADRGVRPDFLTYLGLGLSLVASLLLGRGFLVGAAVVIGLAGLCDILDGDVARVRGAVSRFGAFLDSTLDRIGEGALYAGLAVHYFTRAERGAFYIRGAFEGSAEWGDADGTTLGILCLAILLLSFLVSYARARAEGLGLDCKVGIMERPERMLTLAAGALLGHRFLPGVLGILFILTLVTALQRVYHVWKLTRTGTP